MHARGRWGTYHPELVEGPLPSRSTQGAAWSTPPRSNIKLSTQADHANQREIIVTFGTNIVAGIEITLYMSYLKVCGDRQEQLLTPAAPATILTMKALQIILELSAAEGLF